MSRIKTYLPDQIIDKGITFKLLCLPFDEAKEKIKKFKQSGRRYRYLEVLASNLRGKTDLHGQPYKPTKWFFVQVKEGEERINPDTI